MIRKAKPFVKWVGGKGQLINQLEALLPADFDSWKDATYIEPFVGGGAMLFYMLQRHTNIKKAVINDVNADLVTCYRTVRDKVEQLIPVLKALQKKYHALEGEEARREMFMDVRQRYNEKKLDPVENTALFFFLNRTCFNGLYRVNRRGLFNVPFGKYVQPQICDEDTLRTDSQMLERVEIMQGDFEQTLRSATTNTLFYFDPPYRPLSNTSSFNDYTKEPFNDDSQRRLKRFCDELAIEGHMFMLSNSDSKDEGETEGFFQQLYANYHIEHVMASRNVNANAAKRGKISEIVVRNYSKVKGNNTSINIQQPSLFATTERSFYA